MKPHDFAKFGLRLYSPAKKAAGLAIKAAAKSGQSKAAIKAALRTLGQNPTFLASDPNFNQLARITLEQYCHYSSFQERATPAPYNLFGDDLDANALQQMEDAVRLPISVSGALMPDAHMGYGLPIGGVLAVRNAIIPYAVGMDIACRMRLSVLDLPITVFKTASPEESRLISALQTETRFGIGASFSQQEGLKQHYVMDLDWTISPVTRRLKDKAWCQLGTSGSGNHFVEFGILTLISSDLGLPAGKRGGYSYV